MGCKGGCAIFMIKQENVREIHVIMMIGNTVSYSIMFDIFITANCLSPLDV